MLKYSNWPKLHSEFFHGFCLIVIILLKIFSQYSHNDDRPVSAILSTSPSDLKVLPQLVEYLRLIPSLSYNSYVLEDVKASNALENGLVLPWGQPPERQTTAAASDVTPGEFVLRHLFKDFTDLAEKKIETILTEPLVSLCVNIDFSIHYFSGRGLRERLVSSSDFLDDA